MSSLLASDDLLIAHSRPFGALLVLFRCSRALRSKIRCSGFSRLLLLQFLSRCQVQRNRNMILESKGVVKLSILLLTPKQSTNRHLRRTLTIRIPTRSKPLSRIRIRQQQLLRLHSRYLSDFPWPPIPQQRQHAHKAQPLLHQFHPYRNRLLKAPRARQHHLPPLSLMRKLDRQLKRQPLLCTLEHPVLVPRAPAMQCARLRRLGLEPMAAEAVVAVRHADGADAE